MFLNQHRRNQQDHRNGNLDDLLPQAVLVMMLMTMVMASAVVVFVMMFVVMFFHNYTFTL